MSVKIYGEGIFKDVVPTVFPDKTTQVWKIAETFSPTKNTIIWEYENDAELMIVQQAKDFLKYIHPFAATDLSVPYLPYARQDKRISNDSTWALSSFASIINGMGFDNVYAFDVHNKEGTNLLIERFHNRDPEHFLPYLMEIKPNIVLYPDGGARTRYKNFINPYFRKHSAITWVGEKIRDPATGNITEYRIDTDYDVPSKPPNIVVVDDLCDGGGTFILAAKKLKEFKPASLTLLISHGIYSKGLEPLFDAGYTTIIDRKERHVKK